MVSSDNLSKWHLPQAASVEVSWSLLTSFLRRLFFGVFHSTLVFHASAPSVSLALYSLSGVLAHILSQQWPVLPFFPMSFFCRQRPPKMVFAFVSYVRYPFLRYVKFCSSRHSVYPLPLCILPFDLLFSLLTFFWMNGQF